MKLLRSIVTQCRDELALQRRGENPPGRARALLSGVRLGIWLWRFALPPRHRFALQGRKLF